MAVYTPVTLQDLAPLAKTLGLSICGDLEEVAEGIENTTYFFPATTPQGSTQTFVLTVTEKLPLAQIHFSGSLTLYLKEHGLPVPAPLCDESGHFVHQLLERPALVFPKVHGKHPRPITKEHCRAIGTYLAQSHNLGQRYQLQHSNSRGSSWLRQSLSLLDTRLNPADRQLLSQELIRWEQLIIEKPSLPTGAIHGDLFHDNALFDASVLTGVIDFYNACTDWLLLDVAIVLNDWCCHNDDPALDVTLASAFLNSYQQIRPFSLAEHDHWQDILCLASARFWCSRLLDQQVSFAADNPQIQRKCHEEYRLKLLHRRQNPLHLLK